MNVPIPPGLTTYPVAAAQTYRFLVHVRGGATNADVAAALTNAGFEGVVVQDPPPADWPLEQDAPLSSDERALRLQGLYAGTSSTIPTALDVPGGSAIVMQLWVTTTAVDPVSLSSAAPTSPSSGVAWGTVAAGATLILLGAVLAIAGARKGIA